jgi:RecA-family ATPase
MAEKLNDHEDRELNKFQRELLREKLIKVLNKRVDELEWELEKAKTIIDGYEQKTPEMMKEWHRDNEMLAIRREKNRIKSENESLVSRIILLQNGTGK